MVRIVKPSTAKVAPKVVKGTVARQLKRATSNLKTAKKAVQHSVLSSQGSLSQLGALLDPQPTIDTPKVGKVISKVSKKTWTYRRPTAKRPPTALETLRYQMDLLHIQGKI
jgi:hypothetical protein